jgi:signal recognition particle receptor subunit beta
VPGQVYYNASRKLILKGVDGIVFVADSQIDRFDANVESYMNMLDNLTEHDLSIEKIPFVMQYNKRDLPRVVPVDDLERELNPRKAPYFEAIAMRGTGVFDTLKVACKLVLKTLG